MKIAVLSTFVPFYRGGAEILADSVTERLNRAGHDARQIRLPFVWDPPTRVVESLMAFRMLDLDGYDRVVAFKFPAYCVPHDDKVIWLFHQFRQAYDLWGTPYQHLPAGDEGDRIRRTVIAADTACLVTAPRLYCNSEVTASRLKSFNGRDAEVLYAPLVDPDVFRAEAYGDYIACVSRISGGKRQLLLVEAMAHVRSDIRLVLAGLPDSMADLHRLARRIDELGLRDRVHVDARFIGEEEKADLLARALAVAYVPVDEDSYGFVTLEAFQAHRPVLTCSDSGGVLKLVVDGDSGVVAEPDPESIARGIDGLAARRSRLAAMGAAGLERVAALRIGWPQVIERLVA